MFGAIIVNMIDGEKWEAVFIASRTGTDGIWSSIGEEGIEPILGSISGHEGLLASCAASGCAVE